MRLPPLLALALAGAACGAPARGTLANTATPRPGAALDLGVLLAPTAGHGVLARFLVKAQSDPEPAADEDLGDGKRRAYDLDGDGTVDLLAVSQVMYGPSQGWVVSTREGTQLEERFAISGGWADEREDAGAVALRFEANILAPGEARYSILLRYDRAAQRWDAPVRAYVAQETTPPATRGPYTRFTTPGPATLRATPAVDDSPAKNLDELEDGFSHTQMLSGNVVARMPAGARGLVLATRGEWSYVAFDPAVAPVKSSLAHGMAGEGAGWLCGWTRSSELVTR